MLPDLLNVTTKHLCDVYSSNRVFMTSCFEQGPANLPASELIKRVERQIRWLALQAATNQAKYPFGYLNSLLADRL